MIIRPHPNQTDIILLPDPELQDTRAISSLAKFSQAMDGTDYSYIQTKTNSKMAKFSFLLSRDKFHELIDFHDANLESKWEVIDHNGNTIIGRCITNPLEGSSVGRSAYGGCDQLGETYSVTFEIKS